MARSTPDAPLERSTPDETWHRVTKAWTASYTPALAVKRGERLTSHDTDPDNPGWRWITNDDGLGGWLPEGLVKNGDATEDFDSTELTVSAGLRVKRLLGLNGWSLCQTETGDQGWLPDTHLKIPDQGA